MLIETHEKQKKKNSVYEDDVLNKVVTWESCWIDFWTIKHKYLTEQYKENFDEKSNCLDYLKQIIFLIERL